ncbi:MAG: hypothetical protein EXR83_13525 [Gammaproteobacteria bacterium]|nr:hypothetical protein [Gammaproteobacteria bacterium]
MIVNRYLQELCSAYAAEAIDRRTYIRERRRLIDGAIADLTLAPPNIPEAFKPDATVIDLDATIELPRAPATDSQGGGSGS